MRFPYQIIQWLTNPTQQRFLLTRDEDRFRFRLLYVFLEVLLANSMKRDIYMWEFLGLNNSNLGLSHIYEIEKKEILYLSRCRVLRDNFPYWSKDEFSPVSRCSPDIVNDDWFISPVTVFHDRESSSGLSPPVCWKLLRFQVTLQPLLNMWYQSRIQLRLWLRLQSMFRLWISQHRFFRTSLWI